MIFCLGYCQNLSVDFYFNLWVGLAIRHVMVDGLASVVGSLRV